MYHTGGQIRFQIGSFHLDLHKFQENQACYANVVGSIFLALAPVFYAKVTGLPNNTPIVSKGSPDAPDDSSTHRNQIFLRYLIVKDMFCFALNMVKSELLFLVKLFWSCFLPM